MPLRVIAIVIVSLALSAASAYAGPPFRTDDPEPVELGHWEVYGFSSATHVEGETNGIFPGIEINYGAAPNLQLHLVAPLAFDRMDGSNTKIGYGDTELGAKYRFLEEDENGWRPQAGIFPLLEVSTGDEARGLGTGSVHAFLPLWLQKSFGKWLTYGGGGYWINPGFGNKNYWFAGWLLQRQVTDNLALGGEIFHQTADTVGGADQTGFNLGGIYDFNEHYHLLFSAGRGLQNAASTNEFSYYLALQWTD
ncbi:MAG TPA: hypothetical protein VN766_19160 [Stellaceae bacterium]|jgi:hypothetical protein|nr:hypothetical protein [Stellaceae bacterium]